MGANDPQGVASLDPQGLNWQDLCRGTLNIATYKLWPTLFQRRMKTNDPRGMASLDPRGLFGRIYVGDH